MTSQQAIYRTPSLLDRRHHEVVPPSVTSDQLKRQIDDTDSVWVEVNLSMVKKSLHMDTFNDNYSNMDLFELTKTFLGLCMIPKKQEMLILKAKCS